MLDIERAFQNINNVVRITSDGDKPFDVRGLMSSPFTSGGGNNWNTPLDNPVLDDASSTMQAIRTMEGALIKNRTYTQNITTNKQFKNNIATTKTYGGSNIPSYPANFTLVTYRKGQNVLDDVLKLMSTVLPQESASGSWITPPLNYDPGNFTGTVSLWYGKYFKASNLVVIDMSYTLSREVVPNNTPLYADIQMSLQPTRIQDIQEYSNHFLLGSNPRG